MMERPQEVFTPEEAAEFLRMSVTWLMESDCRRVRFGRSVRFLRGTLLEFAAAHERGAGEVRAA